MGAKTWMLAYVDGRAPDILKSNPQLDRAATAAMVLGALAQLLWPTVGYALLGAAVLGIMFWLFRFDVAMRTVHTSGLTRYVAVCLLAGYGWFALRSRPWAAVALGSVVLFTLIEAASYYFDATILLLAPLAVRPLGLTAPFVGAALADSAIEYGGVAPEAAGALHALVFLALAATLLARSRAAR